VFVFLSVIYYDYSITTTNNKENTKYLEKSIVFQHSLHLVKYIFPSNIFNGFDILFVVRTVKVLKITINCKLRPFNVNKIFAIEPLL